MDDVIVDRFLDSLQQQIDHVQKAIEIILDRIELIEQKLADDHIGE